MSKKLAEKQQRRLAEEKKRAEQKRAARRRNLVTTVVAVVVVALVAVLIIRDRNQQNQAVGVAETEAGCTGVEEQEVMGADHIEVGAPHEPYSTNPPTSGPHYNEAGLGPIITRFYEEDQAPEGIIHNLEHGMIAVWYNPDAPTQIIDDLRDVVDQQSTATLATPWPDVEQPYNFTITAWGALQHCERVSQAVFDEFREQFQGRGPEQVPGVPTFDAG